MEGKGGIKEKLKEESMRKRGFSLVSLSQEVKRLTTSQENWKTPHPPIKAVRKSKVIVMGG